MSMLSTMINTGIFLAVFCLALYIFWKIKKAMNKSKTPKLEKEVGDDKVDTKAGKTSTNLMKVVLWRSLSDGLVAQVGEPIICEERPDENNNLMVINEEKRFKEDLNFQKDRIFENLEFTLRTQNKSKSEKAAILDKKIRAQEDLINQIETDVNMNAKYNGNDEELKLRQLKVLRSSLQMETSGNYMRLGKGGIRQYEFVVVDGILYPYFFGGKWYRVYPDLLVKKKIFNQENTIFRNEIGNLQKNILNWMVVISLAIGVIMMAGGGWMMQHAYGQNSEVTMVANQGALSCTNTLAKINENYGTIINDYQTLKTQQIESIKSPEIPSTNIGGIVIDPSKITNR